MKWKDINKEYKFTDGAVVTQRHQTHLYDCYELSYSMSGSNKKIVASKDHLFKINISKFPEDLRHIISTQCVASIPLSEDVIVSPLRRVTKKEAVLIEDYIIGDIGVEQFNSVDDISGNYVEAYIFTFKNHKCVEVFVKRITKTYESQKIDNYNYWIPLEGINWIVNTYDNLITEDIELLSCKYVGKRDCFCISTSSHQYKVNGLVSHNSVWVQNLILHAIEHHDEISLVLIDPKVVEFENYKGMNGIVAVANTIEEIIECLRIGRAVMYKRNKELAALGCKQTSEYIPNDYSGKIFVCGRELDENEIVKIKINGQEQTMQLLELSEKLASELQEIEICLNDKDWIPANKNCIHKIYNDTMKKLIFVVDEMAEMTMKSGIKTAEAKQEDAYKDEAVSIISSIAQLGRSASVHVVCCTQKPNATVVPTILRSNLGLRVFMGTAAEVGASQVTLDNNLATTIDSTYPGMGIMQVNAQPVFFRGYFSKFSDLEEYYKQRGLNELGYDPNTNNTTTSDDLPLTGDIELLSSKETITIDFESEHTEIDKRQDQNWTEL